MMSEVYTVFHLHETNQNPNNYVSIHECNLALQKKKLTSLSGDEYGSLTIVTSCAVGTIHSPMHVSPDRYPHTWGARGVVPDHPTCRPGDCS